MARSVRFSQYGGPHVLRVVREQIPQPGPEQVLVQVRAIGVNPADWRIRSGQRGTPELSQPRGLGSDAAGVVTQVGPGTSGSQVGDGVVVRTQDAYASHLVVPVGEVLPKPHTLSFEQAAAIGIPAGTAYQVLDGLELAAGETLLLHAGAGGVGQAAIQFAKARGAQVVATASPANHERLSELGAIPVAYGQGLIDRVRDAAPAGVDAALDAAGTHEALHVSLELVPDPRRVGTIVAVERAEELGIRGWSGNRPGFLTDAERALRREGIQVALDRASRAEFDIEIDSSFSLDEVQQAHRRSEAGHVRGKIVLIP